MRRLFRALAARWSSRHDPPPGFAPLFSGTAESERVDQSHPDSFHRHAIARFRTPAPDPWVVWHVWHTTARELADRIYYQATSGGC